MMAPASPQDYARTPANLRREILGAMHALTGTMEPWREVGVVMRQYLGPWVGMSATERWETMGPHELQLLHDAVVERTAIVAANDEGKPREVVVCGGRDYWPRVDDGRWVTYWLGWLSARVVVHGGARGVDRWAGTLAARLGLAAVEVLPDFKTHGRGAPLVRNTTMTDRLPVAVLALPGGSGTADMVAKARARKIHVMERNDPTTRLI